MPTALNQDQDYVISIYSEEGNTPYAEALGDKQTAISRYTELLAMWKHADKDRPELATARRFLSMR